MPAFLARCYRLKEISDYGRPGEKVTEADMRAAIEGAERLVQEVKVLLAS
jgi:hypothetical protein